MVDYKLRLGDGTTFSVDEKGLTTWLQGGLVDDKARVQPAGSKKWFTLKQVLAAQGAQRGHAVRQTEKGRAEVDRQAAEEAAEIERKVAEQRAAEERKAAEDLAAAERKAAEERTAAERKLVEEREAAERRAAEELAAAEARAAAEKQAEADRVEAERRAAEERAAAERSEAEAQEAARVAEAEKLVAAERAERAERKRKAEEARLEAEQRAAEEARLAAERKEAEQRAAQRKAEEAKAAAERKAAEEKAAAERKAAADRAAAERREAEAREAAAREAERAAEAERLVAAERAERAERKRKAEEERRAAEQAAAEERAAAERRAAEERRAADERVAAERRAAEERAAAERRAAEERAAEQDSLAAFHVSDLAEPPATEIAIEPAATMVKVEDFERELGLVPVTFTDGAESPSARDARTDRERAAAATSSGLDRSEPIPAPDRADVPAVKTPAALDAVVLRVVKALDRAVVWVVKSLAPLVGDAVARSVQSLKAAGPKLKGLLARRAAPAAEPAPAEDKWPALAPDAPASRPPASSAPVTAPAPWAAPAPAPAAARATVPAPTPREAPPVKPAVAPPSFDKVGVIPFADGPAPARAAADDEVWDGEDVWEEPGRLSTMFSTAWLWVKRLTILTAVVVTAAVLYLNKEKWLPQSKEAAIVLGESVDKLSDQIPRTIPPDAIEAARTQAPYLRTDTIELIMARSTPGVLEPAEVFRRALQAAEAARPSLPPHIAAEIDHHNAAVIAELDPSEGAQLKEYLGLMRAGTPTADYQDREAVWLMARGVKRFPGERVARMQELFAQAVGLTLQPSPPS